MSNNWNGEYTHDSDWLGMSVFLVVIALALTGLAFLIFGSLDFLIIRQCERHGYWQTGQTRVLCSVERTPPGIKKQGKLLT